MARLLGDAGVKAVFCEDATVHAVEEAVAETDRALVDPAGLEALIAGGRSRRAGHAPAVRRRGPRRPAVHLGHQRAAEGRDAQPPRAARQHRAVPGTRPGTRARRRRRTPRAAALPHLRAQRRASAWSPRPARGRCWSNASTPRATLDVVAAEGVTNIPGAPPMYVAWAALPDGDARGVDARRAAARLRRRAAAGRRPRAARGRDRHHRLRGLRADRDRAGRRQRARLAAGQARLGRPADPGCRGAAGRRAGPARSRPTTTPARSRCAATTCSPATGRTAPSGPDADGWWPTGDVAYADDDGDLFLVDRRIELVLVSGFNVYPREIEDVIAEHPAVAEVAVIAVPDPATGEAVKAYVVARAGPVVERGRHRRPLRHPAGALQAADHRRPRRRRCRTRRPERWRKGGCVRRARPSWTPTLGHPTRVVPWLSRCRRPGSR